MEPRYVKCKTYIGTENFIGADALTQSIALSTSGVRCSVGHTHPANKPGYTGSQYFSAVPNIRDFNLALPLVMAVNVGDFTLVTALGVENIYMANPEDPIQIYISAIKKGLN